MTTYPLTFPDVEVVNSTFALSRVVSSNVSPFTFAQQVYKHQGERWEGSVTFRPMRRTDAALVQSFLAELDGAYGTFNYGDPDALALGRLGAGGGTPLVNGGSQTGNSLIIDGCTPLVTNWLKKGDYFQLGSGATATLHMLIANANTDTGGNTTLNFRPAIITAPADNAAVTITNPMGLFRLTDSRQEWAADGSNIYNITISFIQAISV